MAYHLACSFSLLNDYFMMKPNGSLKHAEFTSDLLEINLINDKMESRGKVISKSWKFYSKKDAIIVNIISVKRINSSYISTALWMIKGSSESIIFFERLSNISSLFNTYSNNGSFSMCSCCFSDGDERSQDRHSVTIVTFLY
ncbi:hypothetical protein BD560DRAFT_494375 [Blakeslea trispora]|nr:hypothetical protein BD560DRAFT_494375 [Blakeslea trispora]